MLELVIAPSGLGKTHHIIEDIALEKANSNIIIVTPDQNSYNFEKILCEFFDGTFDIDVVNLTRLYKKISDILGLNIQSLKDTSKYIYYLELMERFKEKDNFLINRLAQDMEFITVINDLVEELDEYYVTVDKLQEYIDSLDGSKEKFEDLIDLYREYKYIVLENSGYTKQDYIENIVICMEDIDLSEYVFYIDGYYNFSPLEYKIIELLIKKSKKVVLSIIGEIDKYTNFKLEHLVKSTVSKQKKYKFITLDDIRDNNEYSLDIYRKSHEIVAYVNNIILKNNINDFKLVTLYSNTKNENYKISLEVFGNVVEVDSIKKYEKNRFKDESLYFLQKEFPKLSKSSRKFDTSNIVIYETTDLESEMKQLGRNISREIIENNYKLNDIAILYRDEVYENYEYILKDFKLNVHIDKNIDVSNHALIKLVKNIISYKDDNFKSDILNIIKNPLVNFEENIYSEFEEDLDSSKSLKMKDIEKILDIKLINSLQDLEKEYFEYPTDEYKKEDLVKAKNILKNIATQLNKFKKKRKIENFSKEILRILELLGVEKKILQEARESKLSLVELEERNITQQVFDKVVKIIEELREYKNKYITYESFTTIFTLLIDKIRYRSIPHSEDYIIMSKIDLSKVENKKVIFIVGLNKGILPKSINKEGIIDDIDKYNLSKFGIELSPRGKTSMIDEDFVAYIALTRAKEKIYISYSTSNSMYNPQKPSIYIDTIYRIMDDPKGERLKKSLEVEVEFNLKQLDKYDILENELKFYSQLETLYYHYKLAHLANSNAELKKNLTYLNLLYDKVSNLPEKNFNNDMLDKTKVTEISNSVFSFSKLRSYELNPLIYFVENILKVTTEEEYGISPLLLGSYKHAILDDSSLLQYIEKKVEVLGSLDGQELDVAISLLQPEIKNILVNIIKNSKNKDINKLNLIVASQGTNSYIINNILQEFIKVVEIEIYYQILSGYRVFKTEEKFTLNCNSNSISLTLKNGKRITRKLDKVYENIKDFSLKGVIDRIDEKNGSLLVVDYKSSKVDFDVEKFYNKEISQLLVYMIALILLEDKEVKEIKGVFYRELAKKNKLNKEYRLRGIMNESLLKELPSLSELVFVRMKKDGTPYANDAHKVFNDTEFSNLLDINIQNIYNLVEKIQDFEFNLNEQEYNYIFDYVLGERIVVEKEYEKILSKDFKKLIFKVD